MGHTGNKIGEENQGPRGGDRRSHSMREEMGVRINKDRFCLKMP